MPPQLKIMEKFKLRTYAIVLVRQQINEQFPATSVNMYERKDDSAETNLCCINLNENER